MINLKQSLFLLSLLFLTISSLYENILTSSLIYPYQVTQAAILSSQSKSKIAFVSERDGKDAIYIMNSDGSNQHPLQDGIADTYVTPPLWSADGKQILFSLSYADAPTEVHIVNANSSNSQIIVTNNNIADADLALSPDGKYIAFVSDRDAAFKIYIINRDDSNQYRLTQLEPYDSPDPKDQTQPSWSPIDDTLAFLSTGKTGSEIMLAKIDGSLPRVLVSNTAPHLAFDWSPDGHFVAFISQDQGHLCVINVETQAQSCMPNYTDVTFPRWSPDGRFISFTVSHREGYDVFVLEIATDKVQELTDNGSITNVLIPANYDAVWSPDGKQLIFTSGDDFVIPGDVRPARIYIIDADGSNLRALTSDSSRSYSPSWQH